jgi:beta-xylosidase
MKVWAMILAVGAMAVPARAETPWMADNGNGTYTNPLFFEENSDPDLIRVGGDYYMTSTSMHSMPGLAVMHSKDLVNWDFVAYAEDRLDLGPAFRLEDGKNSYGRGIWAPSLRYHNGTFYIFSNVNGETTQLFTARDPKGPWTRTPMKVSLHDLSVLFDDDGKVYAVFGFDEVHIVQLTDDLTGIVPGSDRIAIPRGAGMGEGSHFYKIDGKYYIISADYRGHMHMAAARANSPLGPYEVNPAIAIDEDFGLALGNHVDPATGRVVPGDPSARGRLSLHQGGIVETPGGQWWGFSMMDANSVGRMTALSPVTWKDGWPYFGLPGNLGRTPRTWVKPDTGVSETPHAPFLHSDDFSGPGLNPIWQWNHVPVDDKWSLAERPGYLRLHTLPATSLWDARNTLTQRAVGPQSAATAAIDVTGLRPGDVAGLALFDKPFGWIGVERTNGGLNVLTFDEASGAYVRQPLAATSVRLRADCDFLTEIARFSYSVDGQTYRPLGEPFHMAFQLKTFQGVRYSLFAYSLSGAAGGYADFDAFQLDPPYPHGLRRPIPFGRDIRLSSGGHALGGGRFFVADRGLGRVALKAGGRYVSVGGDGAVSFDARTAGTAETFQWMETFGGDLILMSLKTNRYLRIDPTTQRITADSPGPLPDGSDGDRFSWTAVDRRG